jgi:hypothetical protein
MLGAAGLSLLGAVAAMAVSRRRVGAGPVPGAEAAAASGTPAASVASGVGAGGAADA